MQVQDEDEDEDEDEECTLGGFPANPTPNAHLTQEPHLKSHALLQHL